MDSGSDRLLYFRVVIIVVFLASLSVLFLGFYVFLFFSLCPRLHKGHVYVLGSISCDGTVQWRASPHLDVQAKLHEE
jgi:hypothetical protein